MSHHDISAQYALSRLQLVIFIILTTLILLTRPALALLSEGDHAPDIVTPAVLAGHVQTFNLVEQLKKGPVVLYFFPKAYTKGCTIEAHLFSENIKKFQQLGASVIGISDDSIEVLTSFSKEACRDQFMVASDPDARAIKAYDARFWWLPITKRVSYVITPDQKILSVYSALNPNQHVQKTLSALQAWRNIRPVAP